LGFPVGGGYSGGKGNSVFLRPASSSLRFCEKSPSSFVELYFSQKTCTPKTRPFYATKTTTTNTMERHVTLKNNTMEKKFEALNTEKTIYQSFNLPIWKNFLTNYQSDGFLDLPLLLLYRLYQEWVFGGVYWLISV